MLEVEVCSTRRVKFKTGSCVSMCLSHINHWSRCSCIIEILLSQCRIKVEELGQDEVRSVDVYRQGVEKAEAMNLHATLLKRVH